MTPSVRCLASVASVLATLWLASDAALACACCSNRASRYVAIEKLSGSRLGEIERMTFAKEAFLAETAADHPVELQEIGATLQLAVARTNSEIMFSFQGRAGREASLTLAIPGTISIFEVDPRDGKEEGLGPVLYNEWQLTGNVAATGALQPLVGKGRTVSLILHGRGRGCTEAADFTAWTLLIDAPPDKVTFYGALSPTR